MALEFAITTDAPADDDISERVLTIYKNENEVETKRIAPDKRDLGVVVADAGDEIEIHLVEVTTDGEEMSPIVYVFTAADNYVSGPTGEIGVKLSRIGV